MDCACGVPSRANYFIRIIYSLKRDGETDYAEYYRCAQHTPPLDSYDSETDTQAQTQAQVDSAASLLGLLPSAVDIHEIEVVALR